MSPRRIGRSALNLREAQGAMVVGAAADNRPGSRAGDAHRTEARGAGRLFRGPSRPKAGTRTASTLRGDGRGAWVKATRR